MPALIACLLLFLAPTTAAAHGGRSHETMAWTFDPWIVAPLVITGSAYALGFGRLWYRRGGMTPVRVKAALMFWAGFFTLVLALVSPLHEMGEHLFTFHMIEHELVMAVAAPLLVLAKPIALLLWGLPRGVRPFIGQALANRFVRRSWHVLSLPSVATVLHGITIWIWHVPGLFDATVEDVGVHRFQHLSFFLTGLVFWWAVVWRCSRGRAAWHLFVTMLHTSVLGALIALTPQVLYVAQTRYAAEWGLTALEDQQLAGIIMWVPGGIIYAGATLWFLATWIKAASKGGADGKRLGLA